MHLTLTCNSDAVRLPAVNCHATFSTQTSVKLPNDLNSSRGLFSVCVSEKFHGLLKYLRKNFYVNMNMLEGFQYVW